MGLYSGAMYCPKAPLSSMAVCVMGVFLCLCGACVCVMCTCVWLVRTCVCDGGACVCVMGVHLCGGLLVHQPCVMCMGTSCLSEANAGKHKQKNKKTPASALPTTTTSISCKEKRKPNQHQKHLSLPPMFPSPHAPFSMPHPQPYHHVYYDACSSPYPMCRSPAHPHPAHMQYGSPQLY